jgi:hypothetical protein
MSTIFDMIERGWDNFLARPSGHFGFRFIFQPGMAAGAAASVPHPIRRAIDI